MQRVLRSRSFLAALLAMATGLYLFYTFPFPANQLFLRVISIRAPYAFLSFEWLYRLFLFTTPYMVYATILSGLYIFTLRGDERIAPGRLPRYPVPAQRKDLFLVVGEVHHPRKPIPSREPFWLTIPERGLFTGIAIIGAVGSGKTSCAMYPFAAPQPRSLRSTQRTERCSRGIHPRPSQGLPPPPAGQDFLGRDSRRRGVRPFAAS